MNPKYCGDAKDLFKRGFLNLIRTGKVVQNLMVLPFFTGEFGPDDVAAYMRIIGITKAELLSDERFFRVQGRKEYIDTASIAAKHDLFLDPDRGAVPEEADREVITYGEIALLLPQQESRILMIYDESVNMADRERATREKIDALRSAKYGLHTFAYFNASPNNPNVLFVASGAGRQRIQSLMAELENAGIPKSRLLT